MDSLDSNSQSLVPVGPAQFKPSTTCPHCGQTFEGMILVPDVDPLGVPHRNVQSEIDKLGLGGEVIRLKAAGLTNVEIGEKLSFSEDQVSRYIREYRVLTPEKKRQVHQRSVFHVADELQSHYTELLALLKDAIKEDNPELKLNTLRELRHYMKLSSELVEKLQKMKDDEAYKMALLDILDKLSPGAKAQALKQISDFRQGLSLLKPL